MGLSSRIRQAPLRALRRDPVRHGVLQSALHGDSVSDTHPRPFLILPAHCKEVRHPFGPIAPHSQCLLYARRELVTSLGPGSIVLRTQSWNSTTSLRLAFMACRAPFERKAILTIQRARLVGFTSLYAENESSGRRGGDAQLQQCLMGAARGSGWMRVPTTSAR